MRALMREHGRHAPISQLEAEGYPWSGCGCCKGTVWVPKTAKTLGISIPQALLTAAEGSRRPGFLDFRHWHTVFNFPYRTGSLSQTKSHFPKNFPGMFQANWGLHLRQEKPPPLDKQETRMINSAIRFVTLAMFLAALVAVPPVILAFAAGAVVVVVVVVVVVLVLVVKILLLLLILPLHRLRRLPRPSAPLTRAKRSPPNSPASTTPHLRRVTARPTQRSTTAMTMLPPSIS